MTEHQQVLPCKVYDHQSLKQYREMELKKENKQTRTRKMTKKKKKSFLELMIWNNDEEKDP